MIVLGCVFVFVIVCVLFVVSCLCSCVLSSCFRLCRSRAFLRVFVICPCAFVFSFVSYLRVSLCARRVFVCVFVCVFVRVFVCVFVDNAVVEAPRPPLPPAQTPYRPLDGLIGNSIY